MWRDLTPQEAATMPEARLGGALMAMFALAIAVVVAMAVVTVFNAWLFLTVGPGGMGRGQGLATTLFMVPTAFVTLLALVFAIMTMARARSTPTVLIGGVVVWMVLRLLFTIGGQVLVSQQYGANGGAVLFSMMWPVLVNVAADGVLAAALCGYMSDGTRPNAYFLRRVRTGR
ncbi:MAG: hypothetical protein IPK81_21715 [Rhodospirillales bacterium]|nr:MAG: hypothetical protein IPK81_21715 [Rhodospirillales bacterium]